MANDPISALLEIGVKSAWRSALWAVVVIAAAMFAIGLLIGWLCWG